MTQAGHSTSIFRAYDIRGVYGKDIDESVAEDLGKTFATFIGRGKRIVVSRDTRESGESLKKSFIRGLTDSGCDVIDIGVTTTPMMYFAVRELGADGGVSVTASHNPREWNGFKMTREGGILCSEGFGMEEIKKIFSEGSFANSDDKGKVERRDIFPDYESYVKLRIRSARKMRIVLDPGNGSACGVCERLFRDMGHEVFVINGEPDGTFPNRPSDPLEKNVPKLMEEVVQRGADVGIAFDAAALAHRLLQRQAEGDADVFHRVVGIDVQVPLRLDCEIEAAVVDRIRALLRSPEPAADAARSSPTVTTPSR